jgi:glycosyltransferase involved in cell wall biosynthesis
MRILLVTGIFPPDHGGPASYVPMIASELHRRNHEIVAIVTLSDRADGERYDFPVIRLPRALWRPLRVIKTISTILRHARRADVTYLNGLVLEGIIATRFVGRGRVVVKVVGDLIWEKARNARAVLLDLDQFQRARLPLRWRILRRLQGLYTGVADTIIVPSAYLGGVVRGWGVDPAKIRVVHNAVPLPPPGPLSPLYDLITIARLVPWKGLAELIDVVAANAWSLRVVGGGPLMAELTRRAAASGANVSFAGHVPADRVGEELRSAHLFVLNSSYEGLPHIVLEARAAGVPVIATAAGGTGEIMRHGVDGWVVPVGNREVLTEAIRHLLSHPELRAQLAEEGRRQVAADHSLGKLVDATEAALAGD